MIRESGVGTCDGPLGVIQTQPVGVLQFTPPSTIITRVNLERRELADIDRLPIVL